MTRAVSRGYANGGQCKPVPDDAGRTCITRENASSAAFRAASLRPDRRPLALDNRPLGELQRQPAAHLFTTGVILRRHTRQGKLAGRAAHEVRLCREREARPPVRRAREKCQYPDVVHGSIVLRALGRRCMLQAYASDVASPQTKTPPEGGALLLDPRPRSVVPRAVSLDSGFHLCPRRARRDVLRRPGEADRLAQRLHGRGSSRWCAQARRGRRPGV